MNLSVVKGVFSFVSGQVAKTDPDAMKIDTPVATIGIRGTQVGIENNACRIHGPVRRLRRLCDHEVPVAAHAQLGGTTTCALSRSRT
ncbi:MAG: hypothetical protein VW268_00080 [Rhodospirillaceae bacterium]